MELSRRAVLSVVPAGTLLALAAPLRARADTAAVQPGASAGSGGDLAVLTANTVALFAGTPEVNARPEVAGKLAAVVAAAQAHLEAMDGAGDGELFRGLGDLATNDPNLTKSYKYLYEIALATRTPPGPDGNALHGDEEVQRRVADGLVQLYEHYYGDQSKGYYGNWFNWEIGISQHVSKVLVLLQDLLADYRPGLTADYVAAMDAYLRNGKDGDVDLDSRFHTGANLADITTNRILQGAVLADDARVSKAVADQLTVLAAIDPYHLRHGVTDGFYADGSYLQHASVAYTGTYGTGLLSRVVQTLKLLDGTTYLPDGTDGTRATEGTERTDGTGLVEVVQGWVVDAFAPVIFEGWMMEMVKGRGASRTRSGYGDASTVVESVTDLAAYAAGDDATALKGWVKYVHGTTRTPPDPAKFVSPVTVARYADVLADSSVPARDVREEAYSLAFNAMDRHVHRRPGWAFALARSSKRISKYEYMSGENLLSWFQGDGAHYLYLSGQDQSEAYGVDHFATVPPYRLSGVTAPVEERRTVPELYGTDWYDDPEAGFTASSESQNTYVYFPCATNAHSGGAVLGTYGTASFVQSDDVPYEAKQAGQLPDDFVAYRNARAVKSWFLLDDEIVLLAAGVGDPAGRAVTTTVDSRIAAPADPVTLTGALRGGAPWPGPGAEGTSTAPLAWLRYAGPAGAVGYVHLAGPDPTVAFGPVTASRRAVNSHNADTQVTKQVFGLYVAQPPGAARTALAHVLVPGAAEAQLQRYAGEDSPVSVVANSVRVQAVRHAGLGLLGVNTFSDGVHHAGRVAVTGAASVLVREERQAGEGRADGGGAGRVQVAVADPTTERDTVSVTLHGRSLRAVAADDGVRVRRVPGGTRIDVTTRQSYGRTFTVTLG